LYNTSNRIEIWFAQTARILENNPWHLVLSHPIETNSIICSIFVKTVGPSPEEAEILPVYLQSDPTVLSICSAFMDCCKERTDRHQSEWM